MKVITHGSADIERPHTGSRTALSSTVSQKDGAPEKPGAALACLKRSACAQPQYAAFRTFRRFGSLDGLRAISILAVIWHHTIAGNFPGMPLAQAGPHGVTLFFAISGFLITTLLLRERDRTGTIALRAFYARRTLRIFPLYYTTILIYIILVAALDSHTEAGQQFFRNLKYFLTYSSNIFVDLEDRTIFYFSWSLATEEQFYLVWPPLLALTLRHFGARAAGLLLTATLLVLITCRSLGHLTLTGLPIAIVAGAALALGLHHPRSFGIAFFLLGRRSASLLCILAALSALALNIGNDSLVHLLLALLVGACVIRNDHALSSTLENRVLVWIGTVSYGMYLLHMLCANAASRILGIDHSIAWGLPYFLVTAAMAAGVASLSYRYFEKHFLDLKTRYSK